MQSAYIDLSRMYLEKLNLEKFWWIIFSKTRKASFWSNFGPIWPGNLTAKFFPKQSVKSILGL